jgi:hypothetical protein
VQKIVNIFAILRTGVGQTFAATNINALEQRTVPHLVKKFSL